MRTFLSHEATARWFDTGENEMSETESSGGDDSAMSLLTSPIVFAAEVLAAVDPKSPDMLKSLYRGAVACLERDSRVWTSLFLSLDQLLVVQSSDSW